MKSRYVKKEEKIGTGEGKGKEGKGRRERQTDFVNSKGCAVHTFSHD